MRVSLERSTLLTVPGRGHYRELPTCLAYHRGHVELGLISRTGTVGQPIELACYMDANTFRCPWIESESKRLLDTLR
jgi:hypothetical protein